MKTEYLAEPEPKRWMLVDDNEGVLTLLHHILSDLGSAPVESYGSPREALAAFESSPEAYELVLTDFEMPGMNGVELSWHIRSRSPETKILLMTGSHLISSDTVANYGFCGLLQKPFPLAALKRTLELIGVGKTTAMPDAAVAA